VYLYMMNEGIFFNKYERDPIPLKDARIAEYYGIVYEPEPKVRYIINKYESNPAAADIDDDDDNSDGNTPNVQYVIEQPIEVSYMEVTRYYDHDATPKQFDTSVTFVEMGAASSPDKIVLIPDPSDPTRSTEGHTLHRLKTAAEASKLPAIITPKKKGGYKTRRKGGRRSTTARKSKSKTRSKRGGAKSKKRG